MARFTTENQGKFLMLENPEKNERYEFFTTWVQIGYKEYAYRPQYSHRIKYTYGSTETRYNTSVEDGNEFYKKLLAKGWHKVDTRSFA